MVSESKELKVLFLGFLVSDDVMKDLVDFDPNPQVAANKLQAALVRGIGTIMPRCITVASSVPASDFPRNPKLFFRLEIRKIFDQRLVLLPFLNLLILKQLSRFMSAVLFTAWWLMANSIRESRRVIIVYALNSPHLAAALLASVLFGGRVVIVVPDLPEHMSTGATLRSPRRYLKRVDCSVIRLLSQSVCGAIVLTEFIAKEYFPRVPTIVIEGIADSYYGSTVSAPIVDGERVKVVLYSGGLKQSYGVKELVDAFVGVPNAESQLWLFGRGELEGYCRSVAEVDHRVVVHGFVENREVLRCQSMATLLINPRRVTENFTKYSFPSKLLEYMASGRPVACTRLAGIPEDYWNYLIAINESSVVEIRRVIQSVLEAPTDKLNKLGKRARDFVLNSKGESVQCAKILQFVNGLDLG